MNAKRSPSPIPENESKKIRITTNGEEEEEALKILERIDSNSNNSVVLPNKPKTDFNPPNRVTLNGKRPQLQLQNLLLSVNGVDLRKLCETLSIKFARFKKFSQWEYAFLDFNTVEERDQAIQKLDGFKFNERTLKAAATPDEKVSKSFNTEQCRIIGDTKKKKQKKVKNKKVDDNNADNDTQTPMEKLAEQTTPLWRLSYEEQLKSKFQQMIKVLVNFRKEMLSFVSSTKVDALPPVLSWLHHRETQDELPCQILPIVPSPITDGYRNKCEFSMGINLDGEESVGFLLGLFKNGIIQVLAPDELKHVSITAKKIAHAMQKFIRESPFSVYDREEKKGFWRLLLVRTPRSGDVMVLVQYNSEGLDKNVVDQEKKRMKEFFETCDKNGEFSLTTLVTQDCNSLFNGLKDTYPTEVVIGKGEIYEDMLNLRFRISPFSFFQVNTPAAELLYSTIREWCQPDDDKTNKKDITSISDKHDLVTEAPKKKILLDLCCGTGTIGITMANQVDHVIGIEMVASAVQDAEKNAVANGVSNCTFIADKVENAIQKAINQYCQSPIVEKESINGDGITNELDKSSPKNVVVIAVLDPPRPGVHHKVISAVRECKLIDRVIFVACDGEKSMSNWIDLCKPSSARNQRNVTRPFKLVRAQPFDLFPHTPHCELVCEFVRNY